LTKSARSVARPGSKEVSVEAYPELDTMSFGELARLFAERRPRAGATVDHRSAWLDEVAMRIARHGEHGLELLVRSLAGADEDGARAALLAMRFVDPSVVREHSALLSEVLSSSLHDPRPLVLADTIDTISRFGWIDLLRDPLSYLGHPSPYVVGSAMRLLARHYPEQAKPVLLGSLTSPSSIIRQNAVDELDELGDREALPALRLLLKDNDPDVRQAAATAVRNLEDG
jgi:hypothetical protein